MGISTLKRRVLFIQTQAEKAGAQEISRLLGKELDKRGYDVHHLFFYRKTGAFDGDKNTTIICPERPSGVLGLLHFFHQLFREIRLIKPDVVFTFQHFGNVVGAPAARLACGRDVIANQVSARETIHPLLRFFDLVWGIIGLYRSVTVNSYDLLRDYKGFPIRYTNRLIHVPHGFEEKPVTWTKKQAREKFSIPQDKPLLGTVARLHETKQIDCAIRLLAHDRNWHLAIAGQGPDADRLKMVATNINVRDRVHFLGEMDPDGIGAMLCALDVFVFPSRAETFGLAAVEAGQAGIPLVVNDHPVMREVLDISGEPCAEFVDVKDEATFAASVRHILDYPDHAEKLSTKARLLRQKYSLERMVDTYEAMVNGKALDSVNTTPKAALS